MRSFLYTDRLLFITLLLVHDCRAVRSARAARHDLFTIWCLLARVVLDGSQLSLTSESAGDVSKTTV